MQDGRCAELRARLDLCQVSSPSPTENRVPRELTNPCKTAFQGTLASSSLPETRSISLLLELLFASQRASLTYARGVNRLNGVIESSCSLSEESCG